MYFKTCKWLKKEEEVKEKKEEWRSIHIMRNREKQKKLHFNVPVAIMMPGAAVHDFIGE